MESWRRGDLCVYEWDFMEENPGRDTLRNSSCVTPAERTRGLVCFLCCCLSWNILPRASVWLGLGRASRCTQQRTGGDKDKDRRLRALSSASQGCPRAQRLTRVLSSCSASLPPTPPGRRPFLPQRPRDKHVTHGPYSLDPEARPPPALPQACCLPPWPGLGHSRCYPGELWGWVE